MTDINKENFKTGGGPFKDHDLSPISNKLLAMEPAQFNPILPDSELDTERASFPQFGGFIASTEKDELITLTAEVLSPSSTAPADDSLLSAESSRHPISSKSLRMYATTPEKQASHKIPDDTATVSVPRDSAHGHKPLLASKSSAGPHVRSAKRKLDIKHIDEESESRNELCKLQTTKLQKQIELLNKQLRLVDIQLEQCCNKK